jgi:hypothetical protein
VERGEAREAHRVERASAGRGRDATKHIVAADHMGDPMRADQRGRRLAVELREAHDMRAAGDRGHRRGVTKRSAKRHGAE